MMSIRPWTILTGVAALAMSASTAAPAAPSCEWLAGGAYRADAAAPPQSRALAYGQWFCDQGFDSAKAARAFGGNKPEKKWFAELAGELDDRGGGWRRTYTDFCAGYIRSDTAMSLLQRAERPVGRRLEAAVEACTHQPGLHAWIERTDAPQLFTWRTAFVADSGGGTHPRLDVLAINARCQFPDRSGPNGTATVCRRNPEAATSIGLRSKRPAASGDIATLPAMTRAPQPYGGYTIAGQSNSYTLPSTWPPTQGDEVLLDVWTTSFGSAMVNVSGVNYDNWTPVMICVSGDHLSTDTSQCGAPGQPSSPYGVGGSSPTIGIAVVTPAPYGYFDQFFVYSYLGSGDDACDAFANSGQQGQPPTRWWEYTVDNPPGQNMLFSADVGFNTYQGQYYAVLTNCALTDPSGAAVARQQQE